jgi:hypothetical protein
MQDLGEEERKNKNTSFAGSENKSGKWGKQKQGFCSNFFSGLIQ